MIRKATVNDLDSIMEILSKIILEMHSYNNYQWDENYPRADDFSTDISKGDLFVSVIEDEVVGFVCINRDEPKEYEGLKWSSNNDALVIHRMGVSPDYRQLGIGAELVGLADELAKSIGMKYLKTDTYSLNTKAQGLFEKCGYLYIGKMNILGREKAFYCYDKILN